VKPERLTGEANVDNDPYRINAPEANHPESANNEPWHEVKGESEEYISNHPLRGLGTYDPLGVGPGPSGERGKRRGGWENLSCKGPRGRPPTEESVNVGIWWLARHQNPDGSWGVANFQRQCECGICGGTGHGSFDIGVTGLALLSFTGACYSPGSRNAYVYKDSQGRVRKTCYGEVVKKAAQYLKDIQNPDGSFGPLIAGKFMYNQSVATYAICDLVALMKSKREPGWMSFRDTAQKAVDFLIRAQNPGKAWRYQPNCGDNDISVSGWCAMALKAAEEAEINVPASCYQGLKSHLDDVTETAYGRVGYIEKDGVAVMGPETEAFRRGNLYCPPSLTAVGVMMRIFVGENRKSEIIKKGVGLLIDNLPEWNESKQGKIDYYYWFYGSYALNQYDAPTGSAWNKWKKEMESVLLKNQKTSADGCADGSWDPIDRWGAEAGRVYSTAIACLTLEVYYRLRIVMTK